MRSLQLAVIATLLTATTWAQQGQSKMQTDRPSQSSTPDIVEKGYFQAEAGIELWKDKSGARQWLHPQLLSKYGVSERLELRITTDVTTFEMNEGGVQQSTTGLQPVQVGGKMALIRESKGFVPRLSFIGEVSIPKAASKDLQQEKWLPHLRLVMQNKLSQKFMLNYNLAAEWDELGNPTWIYTINPAVEFSDNWYVFAEYFGRLNEENHPQHGFDAGLAYYLSPHARVDLSGGLGISPNTSIDQFISLGFSFRLH